MTEDEESYTWQIKPKALENNLADFLASQYRMSSYENNKYMEEAILKIKQLTRGEDIIELALSKDLVNFQLIDSIIEYITISLENGFTHQIMACYSYFVNGKIMMESYKKIFRYFENLIRLQKDIYPIVDCVKVMITS